MRTSVPRAGLKALACAVAAATMLVAGAASASAGSEQTAPEMGVQFYPDGDPGQCSGPQQQWTAAPDWTTPIRFDTDSRGGGCQLSFGIHDASNVLSGLSASYSWQVEPGSDAGQCGNQGTYALPITRFRATGPNIRVDTDGRGGWCNLTFALAGRTDIALDVQYWADGDGGQCPGHLPRGQYRSATEGKPVTVSVDADNRPGGCQLELRLRRTDW
ncbi:hypothetical protein [Streptomyces sp. NRRL B-1347]|uniref:hypothetical protein n=1 Tax=Streptomyces sp. NRRL B-1347 TaxID=1476877 RepID=UPI0004C4FC9E|nr:hypothetical protein [Streptomyces sp. NRRL B-1347]